MFIDLGILSNYSVTDAEHYKIDIRQHAQYGFVLKHCVFCPNYMKGRNLRKIIVNTRWFLELP